MDTEGARGSWGDRSEGGQPHLGAAVQSRGGAPLVRHRPPTLA